MAATPHILIDFVYTSDCVDFKFNMCLRKDRANMEFIDAHTYAHVHIIRHGRSVNSLNYPEPFSCTPPSLHLPTCSPLRACVCRHTLLGACLTFFLLHNTRRHRHTCTSSSWASIKKSTSLFSPLPFSFSSFLSFPSFAFFLKLAWGLAEPHQPFALARLHTGTLCGYFKWLN